MLKLFYCRFAAILLVVVGGAILGTNLRADDWTQWRGDGRLGVWNETGIVDQFPEDGLKVKWRVPVRSGFAGPAVADGRVFVLDYQEAPGSRTMDGTERLLCLDEETGEVLWTFEWPTTYRMLMPSYAVGPRATPTVDGDRVYVVGSTGMIFCIDIETGRVIWHKNSIEEYQTSVPIWGVSSSALIDGDLVICIVGGEPDAKVMAFDKYSGEEIWRALSSDWEMGYAQPIIYEAGGVRQLIIWHPKALSSLNPVTGDVYWEQEWEVGDGMTVATPVKNGPYLLVSQFYTGSMMMVLDSDKPNAKMLWKGQGRSEMPDETDGLHSMITTPLMIGDYIYGVGSYGELRSLEVKTGQRVWDSAEMTDQARWSAAFMVRNGDRYFVNNDQGDLIIAQFTPDGYIEIDRTTLIKPTAHSGYGPQRFADRLVNWSHPAYANRHIITRNDEEVMRASLAAVDY